jgi:hypothetical protein
MSACNNTAFFDGYALARRLESVAEHERLGLTDGERHGLDHVSCERLEGRDARVAVDERWGQRTPPSAGLGHARHLTPGGLVFVSRGGIW